MTYAQFIDQLRAQVGDVKRSIHVFWTADGSTTVFQMPTDSYPVYDDSTTYVVKNAGSTLTENTDYVLDKVAGTITMVSAPTLNNLITIDSKKAYLRDEDWINIVNAVVRSLGDDFFKEFVDVSGLSTTAGMLSLSLVSPHPECIAVNEFFYRNSSSENWRPVESITNWRYDRDNNVIYIGDQNTFSSTGTPLKVRGLKTYLLGDGGADDIDVQSKYWTILEYGAIARYWKWRYKDVVELISKQSQESSRTPLQELIMLSDRFDRLYEMEKVKLKPSKPARFIPSRLPNGGSP